MLIYHSLPLVFVQMNSNQMKQNVKYYSKLISVSQLVGAAPFLLGHRSFVKNDL